MAKPQYRGPWIAFRASILRRDGYRCQIGGPTCTFRATEVDHIIPLALGGRRLDPTNARAACKSCNASLGATVGNRLRDGWIPPPDRW